MVVLHWMINASAVRCGLRARRWYELDNSEGWDMGNVTVDVGLVTCPDCIPA